VRFDGSSFAADAAADDWFGWSVAIDGDCAVIGATGDDDGARDAGSAYVFERDGGGTWLQVDKLAATDAAIDDNFGYRVAVSGDYAIVGAEWANALSSDSGAAYVFERDPGGNWPLAQKLTADDGDLWDEFGSAVSVSGDYAIVGAWQDDGVGEDSGSAYVFERDPGGTWTEVEQLIADDAVADEWFGFWVSVSGERAIVGAIMDDEAGSGAGAAYVFAREPGGAWAQVEKLMASDAVADDWFGASVAVSGDQAIVGAFGDDDSGLDSGAAYVFEWDCVIARGTQPDALLPHVSVVSSTWTDTDASAPELYYRVSLDALLLMVKSPLGPVLTW